MGKDLEGPAEAERRISRCKARGAIDLDLTGLGLRELPAAVRTLTTLRSLVVRRNEIRALPPWIGELTQLEMLTLGSNPLAIVPPTIAQLQRLGVLNLDGAAPSALIDALGDLANLDSLSLDRVGLAEPPRWIARLTRLRVLRLAENKLRSLPDWLLGLAHLDVLSVESNPALELPGEVAATQQARKILDYYGRIRGPGDSAPLDEFKLIVVGRGGAGKTSLVHRLVTGEYKTFKTTPGIKITRWPIEAGGRALQAHVWDFGGQEIMHGTHRFFMTERAVYVILLSGRDGTEDYAAEYWLSLVRSFAGDVPIVVLLHKWSEQPFQLNRPLLQQKHGPIAFLETDSVTGRNIDALAGEIATMASALPGLKAGWPTSWRKVKDDLPRRRKSWLTFDDFREFCRERGVDDDGDQEQLAEALHDLGLMLAYRRDESLRGFGVLNPQWATRGIYEILNAASLRDAHGAFTMASFAAILPGRDYPEEVHPYLLALMLKFNLCHRLDERGHRYLIPELLGKDEPELGDEFAPERCLSFVYRYVGVLPEGLLPRFIVASYVLREKRAWRSGAILERAGCRALVRGDIQGRSVSIHVTGAGNERRELFGIIRHHFEVIHKSYEKLQVTEHVPVAQHPDVLVGYAELLAYERAGETKIKVRVGDALREVSVKAMLDGVDPPNSRGNPPARPIPVFIAYSRKDASFLDELRSALALHERSRELEVFCDVLTDVGTAWEPTILGKLEQARIVIMLLSRDFTRSLYCMEQELPRAEARRARGECEIVPIAIRVGDYSRIPWVGKLQMVMPGGTSVKQHKDNDEAWFEVTRKIDEVIKRIRKRDAAAT